jgi:hypothetical protein
MRTRTTSLSSFIGLAVYLATIPLAYADALGHPETTTNPSGGNDIKINSTMSATVNAATGNEYFRATDYVVPGSGLRFTFIRAYNSLDPYSGPLCRGWTHSYNILLTVDSGSGAVTIKEEDGHSDVFQPAAGGTYTAPPGDFDVLSATGTNTFALTRPHRGESSPRQVAVDQRQEREQPDAEL